MPRLDSLARLELAPRHLALLCRLLAEHLPGHEVWAFGSRVNGGAHEGSDLDLVVRDADQPERPVAGIDTLRQALQDSALPMRVDLLDWARLEPAFRAQIERGCLRLQPPADADGR